MNDITVQVSQVVGQTLLSIWYLAPLVILLILFKTPYFKGKIGELTVNLSVIFKLDSKRYHLLKDVTLHSIDGTTQIDHIIVSIYGIFVIETKNMKGWIWGSEAQSMWIQKIYKQSNKFQNPIHQNYKHLKTLASILNIEEEKFHSVVVFTGRSKFKTPMPKNVLDRNYTKYIKSKRDVLLSESSVHEIIDRIQSKQLAKSFKANKEHIKRLKEKHQMKKSSQYCPKCGNILIKRITKKGINKGQVFYGCSTFPRCRYTRLIKPNI